MTKAVTAAVVVVILAGIGAASRVSDPETPLAASDVRVILNPYGIAPLSALVVVAASAGIDEPSVHRVEVSVAGSDGRTRTWSLPYGSPRYLANFDTSDLEGIAERDVVIPILGLEADATTRVTLRIHDDTARRTFTCEVPIMARLATDPHDPLGDGYPKVVVSTADRQRMEPGMTLVSFSMGNRGAFMTRPFIVDSTGRLRWVLRLDGLRNWASPVEPLENGNLLLGRGEYVYEYSMLGRQVRRWDIARYGFTQHHDIFEIRRGPYRGDLLVAVDRINADTVEDFVIELDHHGALVDKWDLRQVMDVSRYDVLKNSSDWLHMNAVVYDARDDTIIVSGRNQGVAKVDRAHRLRWILAPHQGWGNAGLSDDGPDTSAYLLTATGPSGTPYPEDVQTGRANVDGGRTFDWPWGQHSIDLLPNGNLLLFDNGFNRLFRGQKAGFSRAVEYRLDERARKVSQVWEYGADRGTDYYSSIISDVDALPATRNRLVTSGSVRDSPNAPHAYVTEITHPGGQLVFEARIGFLDAHSDLAAGGWGNMDIVYRAERMPLYPGAGGD